MSAGGYTQDPLPRPTGADPEQSDRSTPYPRYTNEGTTQPKFDARVDYDLPDGAKLESFSGGVRRHRRHHAHRHRAVRHRQRLGDGLRQGQLHTRAFTAPPVFTNILNGDATNLSDDRRRRASRSCSTSTPRRSTSRRATRKAFGPQHVVTYGGNLRCNSFDLSIAPAARTAPKAAATCRTRSSCNDQFRLSPARASTSSSSIDNAVFSPRVGVAA